MHCCKYCKKDFSTKGTLTRHQKTSKTCSILNENGRDFYNCEFCNSSFTQNSSLIYHLSKCRSKKNNDFEDMINILKEDHRKENSNYKSKIQKIEKDNREEVSNLKHKIKNFNSYIFYILYVFLCGCFNR